MSNNILSVIYKIKVLNVVFKVYDLFHLNLIVFINPIKTPSQYGMCYKVYNKTYLLIHLFKCIKSLK